MFRLNSERLEERIALTCSTDFSVQLMGSFSGIDAYDREITCLVQADVNNDGEVSPLDALAIVNELTDREFSDPDTGVLDAPIRLNGIGPFDHLDVNDDSRVTPLDALLVINRVGNSPRLDLDSDTLRNNATQKLEWDAESVGIVGPSVTLDAGEKGTLESLIVRWPILDEISVDVDTLDTAIDAKLESGQLTLSGVDSADNYLRVLRTVNLSAENAGLRDRQTFNVLFEVSNGEFSTRSMTSFEVAHFSEQLIGLPLEDALEFTEEQEYDNVRIIEPNSLITLDLRSDRFNISVDEFDIVTDVGFY